jgi:hypothetical protein
LRVSLEPEEDHENLWRTRLELVKSLIILHGVTPASIYRVIGFKLKEKSEETRTIRNMKATCSVK